jgi:hypothetical protein
VARCPGTWATDGGEDDDGYWWAEEEHRCFLDEGHEDEGELHLCAEHFGCQPSPWAVARAPGAAPEPGAGADVP